MPLNNIETSPTRQVSFGPFRLLLYQRLLLQRGEPVPLGSRALDILATLVERPGELVTRDELMSRVWPDTVVVPANLTVHIAALRRVLGDGQEGRRFVITVPGRGYRFVAPVALADRPSPPVESPSRLAATHDLPALFSRPIGRGEIIDHVCEQSPLPPLLTLVGPGGVGKSTVAIAAAQRLTDGQTEGLRYVDLAAAADFPSTLESVAAAFGVESPSSLDGLTTAMKDRSLLLVLDNCVHAAGAAQLAAKVLKTAPGVRTIATSREPLDVDGERLLDIPPLAIPAASGGIAASEAMKFAAVRLFVDRAAAIAGEFALADSDAPLVVEICCRLDGLPLAIKLAAHSVVSAGLHGITHRFEDFLDFSMPGAWTVPARHQSLRASLEWSYAQLCNTEQRVFRRLAVFAGGFTPAAAAAVIQDAAIGQPEI
jgi:DNA-binding winged helix-turn-helix (wHTH) protein